jgi:hypothetical protein
MAIGSGKYSLNKLPSTHKTRFFRVAVFLFLLFAFDFLTGHLLRYLYFKQDSGLLYRTTYSIEKTSEDLLIFGSSRANHHYYPDNLESKLHVSYYNSGRDGSFILYHYAVLKAVLRRYNPKIIILDLSNEEFMEDENSYIRLSSLLPYYKGHSEIRSILDMRGSFEKYKMFSDIYPFNSLFFTILIGNADLNKERKKDFKGYIPLSKIWHEPIKHNYGSFLNHIDTNKVVIYKYFIQECLRAKVKLYVVRSPYYIVEDTLDYSIKLASKIAKAYKVPFFDFGQDSVFMSSPDLFADPLHLNDHGAKVFTQLLVTKITGTNEF